MLALLPSFLDRFKLSSQAKRYVIIATGVMIIFELMPLHRVSMVATGYKADWMIPKVYTFIKDSPEIDNLIILNPDYDYPGVGVTTARAEQVMWAGYHNKNIFNGYSGYEPPNYVRDFEDYVDFDQEDVTDLKSKQIHYVLVDKGLSTQKPWVDGRVSSILNERVYSDSRYSLYKVQ
jgi:hypothetical protein